MKMTLPSACATPRPSWSSDSTRIMLIPIPGSAAGSGWPKLQEFEPVRVGGFAERGADKIDFLLILVRRQRTAHQLKPQIDEIGVRDIRFTVAADLRNVTVLPGLPDL